MEIQRISVSDLIPYEFNNKIHNEQQVNLIANSISEFGFNQPLVVDEKNIILVGHGRWAAAKKLGLQEVPVLKLKNLNDVQKKAYRVLDNKLGQDAAWDFQNLKTEFEILKVENFDFKKWNLEEFSLEVFKEQAPPTVAPEITQDNFTPDENAQTKIKKGDLIELGGGHRVLCGDSTNQEDFKKLVGAFAPVLMVTDPPYGVEYDPSWREGVDLGVGERSKGKVQNDDKFNWIEVWKIWSPQIIYCWHSAKFAYQFAKDLLDANFEIISQIIWVKQHFALSRGDYHWQHEPCWYAVRSGEKHNWQGARDQATTWQIKNNNAFGGGAEETFGHGTQKPIECMARPIINNSQKNEIVCDPFLGSGTTLIAAEQLDRICYGMEIDPKYCQAIIDRYRNWCTANKKEFKCLVNSEVVQ